MIAVDRWSSRTSTRLPVPTTPVSVQRYLRLRRGAGSLELLKEGEDGPHGRRVPLSRKKAFAAMGGGVGGTR